MTEDKGVVLVTGGATGMGREIAVELARDNWKVAICDIKGDDLEAAAFEASEVGTCEAWLADITSSAEVQRFVAEAERSLGPVTGLINNALHPAQGFLLDLDEAEWRRTIDVSLTGYFLCIQAAGRRMRDRGYGRIVNMSSGAAERGIPRTGAYGSAKGGVNSLTRILAVELAHSGVTVNTLTTGPILTEGFKTLAKSDDGIEARRKRVPVGRLGETADYMPLLSYLLSPESAWTTGALFHVDGGANNAALVQVVEE
jgi:NAD(P)-dependent dehydrogenase (short-subunit alcohol dehydrogenase family)